MDSVSSRWLSRLVTLALDVNIKAFDEMMSTSIAVRPEDDPQNVDCNKSTKPAVSLIDSFFSESDAGSVLFFYTTERVSQRIDEETQPTQAIASPDEDTPNVVSAEDNQDKGAGDGQYLTDENITIKEIDKNPSCITPSVQEVRRSCQVSLNIIPPEIEHSPVIFLIKINSEKVRVNVVSDGVASATRRGQLDRFQFSNIELACSNGDLLSSLEGVVCHVFLPLLEPEQSEDSNSAQDKEPPASLPQNSLVDSNNAKSMMKYGDETERNTTTDRLNAFRVMDAMRHEFKSSLVKLSSQITTTMQQLRGESYLVIPDVEISTPESHVNDNALIIILEQSVEEWCKSIAKIVEEESRRAPKRNGPLGEIEFWRERYANLSMVCEQSNVPRVQKMLKVLDLVEANVLLTFKYHFSELTKLHIEAKDNVKFLTTLERHFKNLATGSFSVIADTLPSMMNAIRMVWIISRHYNTDERVVPLMERIALEIARKVSVSVDIHRILSENPVRTLQTIEQAKLVLEMWFSTYMSVRERIETSGTDHRWEFDRKRLFEQTNYMAKVCDHLLGVVTVLIQFNEFLGPELKFVTGDSKGIEEIQSRVNKLISPFDSVSFRIFDRSRRANWEAVMAQFQQQVEEIENLTRKFIDSSFQKLRSAEGAFNLLQNFQNIQSRESINRQMMEKYQDILMQYTKELETLESQFQQRKDNPPLYKHHPPVAGAIAWARSLYLRAKKTILRFREMNDLLRSPLGEEVKERYLVFARAIDAYIKALHAEWKDKTPQAISEYLRQSILGPKLIEVGKSDTGGSLYRLPDPPYFPNFASGLIIVIRESKYLDRLGFDIPESALNVTLQEEKYHQHIQELTLMLKHYDSLLFALTPVEKHLLRIQLEDLREVLRVGFSPLNWNSQRITSFTENCNRALNQFGNLVSQIHKTSKMVDDIVLTIKETLLIRIEDFEEGVTTEVSDFYEIVERNRVKRIEELLQKYRSIGPLLIKVEELVAGVNTGASPKMSAYYLYWERRIFNAITQMIIASMITLQALLNVHMKDIESSKFYQSQLLRQQKAKRLGSNAANIQSSEADSSDVVASEVTIDSSDSQSQGVLFTRIVRRAPVCKIKATMNGKDIIVTPSLSDMYKYLSKSVKHIVESAKAFIRWMHGTCRETEPLVGNEDDEPILFTFYSDISQNPYVLKLTLSLNQEIHKGFNIVNKYLDSWRRYDMVYNLWNTKRRSALDKLADKNPPFVYFDTRMAQYSRLAEAVRQQPTEKDSEFLQIDCLPVAISIAKEAELWKDDYGRILYQLSSKKLKSCTQLMDSFEEELTENPVDLDTLKKLLHTITRILDRSMEMELEYCDIIECFRTLKTYEILVDEGEREQAMNLERRWSGLLFSAKSKDHSLVQVKMKFRAVTENEAIQFKLDCQKLKDEILSCGPGIHANNLDVGLDVLQTFKTRMKAFQLRRQELSSAENLFALPMTCYPELQEVVEEMEKQSEIFSLYSEAKEFISIMGSVLWVELDVPAMTRGVEELETKIRLFSSECKKAATFAEMERQILAFKDGIPLIQSLKNDAMKPRHWEQLMALTGVKFDMNVSTFTLTNLFSMQLHQFGSKLAGIVNASMQEQKIEQEINKIEEYWSRAILELTKYKKNGQDRGCYVLRSADELRLQLEDHMLNLQTISGSRFVSNFSERVRKWEKRFNLVGECLKVWFLVQQKWMYLESIFVAAEDIRQQLPEEAKIFDAIDKAWKSIMATTFKNANALDACTSDNRLDDLRSLSDRLDNCQKSLSDFLDTKRNTFSRFYFISDDELLSVLGSSDPISIQTHMLKLFDNVKQVVFHPSMKKVVAMESSEGESFYFRASANVEGPVESWMSNVEAQMKDTLHTIVKEGVFNYARFEKRTQWLDNVLGMVSLVGSQIWWTWEVEDVFHRVRDGNKYAMKNLEAKLADQLRELVQLLREPLSINLRKKVNTLLITDVHAHDIVDSFVRNSILHEKEFAWESQLRFYWKKDINDVLISQCTGSFRFGYEYISLSGRLVITPLTDRCYMTLTQALTFKLGGSPCGPAGTGKTETVKDLAKSLALPCYVINCGEGLDYKAMGYSFSGLLQVGAWGCFDEFNRINIEVLSVVSAQMRAIQNALHYEKPTVDIGFGTEVRIHRTAGFATCGFFITMNPGYAGRTELPDNLKALFRPVTMVVPDSLMIAQIMLFSEGFENAVVLAKKMTLLYKLSQEQLSKQYHYDFGLRALKSVLVTAGILKRKYPDMSEDLVLMRALRDSNMPKFVYEDVPLFKGLINDLLSGSDYVRVGYEDFEEAIIKEMEDGGYRMQNERVFRDQIDKIIQMYETLLVRHTTMIVGPTGGGKSHILKTLVAASKTAFNTNIRVCVLNPKALPISELYGFMDTVTRDWTDGILSKLFRELNQPLPAGKENEKRWLVFDGDVDAFWVENMNSAMDDNKILTLPNGERIRLQEHCSMVCEAFDLQYASPATISRCGMVWVDPKNLGYRPYFERWLRQRCSLQFQEGPTQISDQKDSAITSSSSPSESMLLLDLFDSYVPKCIEYVLDQGDQAVDLSSKCRQVIPVGAMEMCKQLCTSIDTFLRTSVAPTETEEKTISIAASPFYTNDMEGIFLFSIMWSIGSALVDSSRHHFDRFLRKIAEGSMPPPTSSIYQYYYCIKSHKWQPWESQVMSYVQPSPFSFGQIFVPTTDSVLYDFLLTSICKTCERPVLFVGDSGTAKTVIIDRFLSGMDTQKAAVLSLNFSSQTSSMDVQKNIQRNVDKRTGQIYGPAAGKKLFVFVDDLNMPKMDMYGTQQPIALLHFMMNQGAFYDRAKDLDLRFLRDVIFLGAMGPPSGGRNPVDPRFVALFNVYKINPPTTNVLKGIFGSIVSTFLKDFNLSVQETGSKLTDVLLKLFSIIREKCLPTPAKFHYIFNLRDLGRVCEGLCLATPDVIQGPKEIVRLFRNEITRVFCDRLTNETDLHFIQTTLCTTLKDHFSHEVVEHALVDPLVFGDFAARTNCLKNSDSEDPRLYEDLGSYQRVRRIMEEVIEIHNMDHKPMTLVLFEMVLDHLCRLFRILKTDFGHALLIGTGGYGKQSLSRLAAFTAQYEIFEIFLTRSYGETEFREDLKTLYRKLGTKKVVFLFTDAHAVNEAFIEYLNNMLTTGTVQALFDQEERDAITCTLREEVREAGVLDSSEMLWKYYIDRCRKNLHIILAMSPSGNVLRTRCRNFPGLISGTIIDWFFPWPQTALFNVAEHCIQHEKLPDQFREAVTNHLVHAHMRVVSLSSKFTEELRRHYYVTPKNYLDYIATYRAQLKDHHQTVNASILRLNGGLAKLVEASKSVDTMQIELSEKKVVVDEKTLACEALIQTIEEKSLVATRQQNVAKVAQAECEKASLVITKEKDDADAALLEALPAVEAAAAALQDLSKADLTEIKSFASPPALVMSVCMCVLILKPTGQELDLDWKGAKVMLSNPNLLMLLKEYEKSRISSKMISKIKTFLKNPDLNIENMKSISKAGSGLLVWLLAMIKYYDVAKNVEPLRNKVKSMEKEQAVKEQELEDLNDTIKSLRQELENLSTQYQEANTELQGLKSQAEKMAKRLQAANKLLAGLASERVRWTKDVGSLQEQSGRLIGDCLLNASFLSYAGAFNFDYRTQLIYKDLHSDLLQRGIPTTDPFKLERSLTDDSTMQKWISEGLPADENSIENGILTTKASRFPLCVDPQQQAVSWIKKKEEANNLTVKTLSDSDFMKHLELAIQFGNPFLFESVGEELDPILDPILDKNTFVGGSQLLIKLGGKNIEWDENFRLYFTSKLANPHYSPEIMSKTMIINYSVTQKGLTNQLLDVVVGHERPDLEEQYHHLVMEMSENTQLIVELEDTLLRELSSSTGNVLDNQELIDLLDETKNKATEIGSKLNLSSSTKDEITTARAVYTPVASRGSAMYFSMAALCSLMKMYEISLSSFLVVFNTSLNHAKRDTVMSKRLRHMIQSVTELTYEYMCTGIFERHKLIFAFQMTCMILQEAGSLERSELDFFLKGSILIDKTLPPQPDSLAWISSIGWKDLIFLSKSKKIFADIEIEIAKNADYWKRWADSEAPEAIPFPNGYSDRLTELQKLLLLRCFRQDRAYNAMELFVSSVMGEKYVQPPVLDYERIYSQSSPISPIVCILSPGADPQGDIQALSETHGFSGHRFRYLALGQGQGHLAEQMVEIGYVRGHWVLLQNCHLLASWLKTLEKILACMHRPHKDFRLWLTTEPTDYFPLGILQRSLKVVTEPPDGLKQNMRSVYAKLDQSMLDECPHPAFPSLVYVLCFLHAVVLERRKYGKIGWNVNYDFNDSDFNISRKLLGLYLYKAQEDGDEQLPWGSLRYIIGDAMYGGRVSDEYDRRILTTYLSEYMGDFLFDDCQPFYFSRSGHDYCLPSSGSNINAYIETVDRLPLTNSPAVFGLNPNAEIGYYTSMSKTVWKDLISLQPRSAENTSGQSREDRIAQVAVEIQSQLPESFDVVAVRKQFPTPKPTQIVLMQELDRWNALHTRMYASLQDLRKALVGDIGMSDELDALGNELYDASIPKMWRMLSPDTEKPLASYFSHLLNRHLQYTEWIKDGELKVVWLSGLSVPESYLTALMQATCREKKWALDKTTMYTKVTSYMDKSEVESSDLEIGCYVHGMFLEGASWDRKRGCLAPQRPKQLIEELPLLHIIPIEINRLKLQNTFRAPVYITQARRNAMGVGSVFEADLHSTEHESHWILQGVALCLNTDF